MGRREVNVYSDSCCLRMLQINVDAKLEQNDSKHGYSESNLLQFFSEYLKYGLNLEEAIEVIKEYEVSMTSTFTATYQTKGSGNTPLGKNKLYL